jgi:hypothetical protein
MAEPSRATWISMGADQPRVCAACGGVLRMTKDALWLDTLQRLSWHFSCRPRTTS